MDVCHSWKPQTQIQYDAVESQYQHFFGTTTVMDGLDCNLTSVLVEKSRTRTKIENRIKYRMLQYGEYTQISQRSIEYAVIIQ